MTDHAVVLDLQVRPEAVDDVQDALARLWELDADVTMLDRIRFETALVEIVGNVVEHAYALDSSSGHDGGRALQVRLGVLALEPSHFRDLPSTFLCDDDR